jgi:hypothetical protein
MVNVVVPPRVLVQEWLEPLAGDGVEVRLSVLRQADGALNGLRVNVSARVDAILMPG